MDARHYLLECTQWRKELDDKLIGAYQQYGDEDYKGGNATMLGAEDDFRQSMADCDDPNNYFDDIVNTLNDFLDLPNWEDIVNANYADNKELVDHQSLLMFKSWNEGIYFNAGMFYGRIWYMLAQGCLMHCEA